jgi:hypothetical protein
MAGGVEFGRIYNTASTADKSMRSAARYLARVPASAVCGQGFTNAKNLAVYGQLTAGTTPLIAGWAPANVKTPTNCSPTSANPVIQLKADVPWTAIMLSTVGLSNSMTLHVQHEERWIGE